MKKLLVKEVEGIEKIVELVSHHPTRSSLRNNLTRLLKYSLAQAREEIVITQKYSQGKDEMYCEFFICTKCQSSHVGIYDKYCSECGSKIKWLLSERR